MSASLKMFKMYFPYALALLAVACFSPGLTNAQDNRAPQVISQPVFKLSDEAVAAGLDGVLGVSLTIDKTGKVKNAIIHGGPSWPCGSKEPTAQINAVRESVKQQLLSTTFAPPLKSGKPTEADLSLQFAIGDAYKAVVKEEDAVKSADKGIKLVEAGVIKGRATRLVKPVLIGMSGVVFVRAQIDEDGSVVHAGAITGHPRLQENARDAACASKFSPTILHGKPVKVTGTITYVFRRG